MVTNELQNTKYITSDTDTETNRETDMLTRDCHWMLCWEMYNADIRSHADNLH